MPPKIIISDVFGGASWIVVKRDTRTRMGRYNCILSAFFIALWCKHAPKVCWCFFIRILNEDYAVICDQFALTYNLSRPRDIILSTDDCLLAS